MDSFETRIEAKCIEKPDNEKCWHNGMDFADDKCRAAYEANIGKIIADINDTVNDLFNDPMCCGYGEDGLEDYYGLNHFFDLEDGELVCVRFDPRAI